VEFRILGPLEVTHEGRPVVVPGSRERAVLVLLLASANRVVPAERLLTTSGPGGHRREPPGLCGCTISRYVGRCVKRAATSCSLSRLATSSRSTTARSTSPASKPSFTRRAARSPGPTTRAAAATLHQALALWRGAALADAADAPLAQAEAARSRRSVSQPPSEARVEADLACGRHAELVSELDSLTRMHPLRGTLCGVSGMVALYRCGRQADALRAYQGLRHLLAEEMGLEPSHALTRLGKCHPASGARAGRRRCAR